jgi:hypothetical protein
MAVRMLALRAGRTLLPTNIFWYSFLIEVESTPGPYVRLKGLGKLNDLFIILTMHVVA